MSFIPHTEADRDLMLKAIGVTSMEDLFCDVPETLLFPDLDLPDAESEIDVVRRMRVLSDRNQSLERMPCFLGAGAYHHFIPATVKEVLSRGEFYTAYTPYQPEASQGMLQAMFEYQSMICRLTEMDVSNASHYDGATALAEAVMLALTAAGKNRNKITLSPNLNPQYVEVVKTYTAGQDVQLSRDLPLFSQTQDLIADLDETTAAVVIQNPNFFGQFEKMDRVADAVHQAGALLIVVPDPLSLGLFNSPGSYGADLVAAEGQSLGIPLSFGGPHLGIFALTESLLRKTVGRLVGETRDSSGKRGYVLTLSTREQHIRREKATSNICTNSALTALASAVYMATLGNNGLRQVANLCYQGGHYAAANIGKLRGYKVNAHRRHDPFFCEFVLSLQCSVKEANYYLATDHQLLGGYDLGLSHPQLDKQMLLAVTELNTREEIDRLVGALAKLEKLS